MIRTLTAIIALLLIVLTGCGARRLIVSDHSDQAPVISSSHSSETLHV